MRYKVMTDPETHQAYLYDTWYREVVFVPGGAR